MAHLADQLHIDKQIIDRVESAVLLSLSLAAASWSVYSAHWFMILGDCFRFGK
jgi:hypothetical protein